MNERTRERTLLELVDTREPGMAIVHEWLSRARPGVELLSSASEDGERCLLALQVTTRSPMGAIAYGSGGILVDNGWLRILGAGCPRLPRSIAAWNAGAAGGARCPGALLVADDALGGFFAINGGGLPGKAGSVAYLAPDTLRWEDLGFGYSAFVCWATSGDTAKFYQSQRWPGWEQDVASLPGDRAYAVYPMLLAKGAPIAERKRSAVPIEELWGLYSGG